jgi:uncharacterized protein
LHRIGITNLYTMKIITHYIEEFWILTAEMSPYLLLGLLIAGVLHVYVSSDVTKQYLGGKTIKSVLYAALIGVPLPLCSCGVIPTGIGFRREGASKGATVSFLISTPQTGVDSILVTYSMLGLPMALLRPIIAFVTGIAGGIATNATEQEVKDIPAQEAACSGGSCCANPPQSKAKFREALRYAFIEFLEDISFWLTVGLLIASVIAVAVPDSFFEGVFSNSFLSMIIILVASVPVYVCATGSVPIAAMLLLKGLSPGTALVFLMAGPATNAATITVLSKTLGQKTTIVYVASIVIGALVFGLMVDYLLPREWFAPLTTSGIHDHHSGLPWWKEASAVVLVLLILFSFYRKYWPKQKQKIPEPLPTAPRADTAPLFSAPFSLSEIGIVSEKTIGIDGMTCNHCKNSVEKTLSSLAGISSVKVDLASKTAVLTGKTFNLAKIEEALTSIGYSLRKYPS